MMCGTGFSLMCRERLCTKQPPHTLAWCNLWQTPLYKLQAEEHFGLREFSSFSALGGILTVISTWFCDLRFVSSDMKPMWLVPECHYDYTPHCVQAKSLGQRKWAFQCLMGLMDSCWNPLPKPITSTTGCDPVHLFRKLEPVSFKPYLWFFMLLSAKVTVTTMADSVTKDKNISKHVRILCRTVLSFRLGLAHWLHHT